MAEKKRKPVELNSRTGAENFSHVVKGKGPDLAFENEWSRRAKAQRELLLAAQEREAELRRLGAEAEADRLAQERAAAEKDLATAEAAAGVPGLAENIITTVGDGSPDTLGPLLKGATEEKLTGAKDSKSRILAVKEGGAAREGNGVKVKEVDGGDVRFVPDDDLRKTLHGELMQAILDDTEEKRGERRKKIVGSIMGMAKGRGLKMSLDKAWALADEWITQEGGIGNSTKETRTVREANKRNIYREEDGKPPLSPAGVMVGAMRDVEEIEKMDLKELSERVQNAAHDLSKMLSKSNGEELGQSLKDEILEFVKEFYQDENQKKFEFKKRELEEALLRARNLFDRAVPNAGYVKDKGQPLASAQRKAPVEKGEKGEVEQQMSFINKCREVFLALLKPEAGVKMSDKLTRNLQSFCDANNPESLEKLPEGIRLKVLEAARRHRAGLINLGLIKAEELPDFGATATESEPAVEKVTSVVEQDLETLRADLHNKINDLWQALKDRDLKIPSDLKREIGNLHFKYNKKEIKKLSPEDINRVLAEVEDLRNRIIGRVSDNLGGSDVEGPDSAVSKSGEAEPEKEKFDRRAKIISIRNDLRILQEMVFSLAYKKKISEDDKLKIINFCKNNNDEALEKMDAEKLKEVLAEAEFRIEWLTSLSKDDSKKASASVEISPKADLKKDEPPADLAVLDKKEEPKTVPYADYVELLRQMRGGKPPEPDDESGPLPPVLPPVPPTPEPPKEEKRVLLLPAITAEEEKRIGEMEQEIAAARTEYYKIRRERTKWFRRSGYRGAEGEQKLDEARKKYDDLMSRYINLKTRRDLAFSSFGSDEERREAEVLLNLRERNEEDRSVWSKEFSGAERSKLEKFKTWWNKKKWVRLGVGIGLAGGAMAAPALLGAAGVTLSAVMIGARGVLSGTGTAVGTEAAIAKWSSVLGEKGLTNRLYKKIYKKGVGSTAKGLFNRIRHKQTETVSPDEVRRALQEELSNISPEELRQEMQRLNALAERQGVALAEVGGGSMKEIINGLYEANLMHMYEEAHQSKEDNPDYSQEEHLYEGVTGFLNKYSQDLHRGEELAGLKERGKEMWRWVIAGVAGGTVGGFIGHKAFAKPKIPISHNGAPGPLPGGAGEAPGLEPPSAGLEATPVPLPEQATKILEGVDAGKARSVWAVIDLKYKALAHGLGGKIAGLQEVSGSEGRSTYVLDAIKDRIAAHPEQFGLPKNIDLVTKDQLMALAKNPAFNKLVEDSLIGANGGPGAVLEHAKNLAGAAVKSIEGNNAFYRSVVSGAKGVMFDQHAYNLMDQAHHLNLNPQQALEILQHAKEAGISYDQAADIMSKAGEAGLTEPKDIMGLMDHLSFSGADLSPDAAPDLGSSPGLTVPRPDEIIPKPGEGVLPEKPPLIKVGGLASAKLSRAAMAEVAGNVDKALEPAVAAGMPPEMAQSILKELGPKGLDFYLHHPNLPPSEEVAKILTRYGAKAANRVVDVTGGNVGVNVEDLIASTPILKHPGSEVTRSWLELAHSADLGNAKAAEKAMESVLDSADIKDKFFMSSTNRVYDAVVDGTKETFRLNAVGRQVKVIIDNTRQTIEVRGNGIDHTVNFAYRNPSQALKEAAEYVMSKGKIEPPERGFTIRL